MARTYIGVHYYNHKGEYCTHDLWYTDGDFNEAKRLLQDNNPDMKLNFFEVTEDDYNVTAGLYKQGDVKQLI